MSAAPVWAECPEGVSGQCAYLYPFLAEVWAGPTIMGHHDYRYLLLEYEPDLVSSGFRCAAGGVTVAYEDGFETQDAARAMATQVLENGGPLPVLEDDS